MQLAYGGFLFIIMQNTKRSGTGTAVAFFPNLSQ